VVFAQLARTLDFPSGQELALSEWLTWEFGSGLESDVNLC